ncbi:uncharacterized protein SPSK_03027 [Sporothrix schenckii 1099-18]|uniref:Uncharacterized protein n=1 Tax=Sporothrix schenckii 1099-18 TaxID=1397361 RepID=A0A0F2LWQ3_SPOSC|nr:uncharacterized protein SPSK_03027 [Sporothrix schenckii 1099-18]KJR81902.1 hypothetical protein SPSK_03027 [Sporothrix schenckii 1099-18]
MSNGVAPNGSAHTAGGSVPVPGVGVGAGDASAIGVQPPSLPEDDDADYNWDEVEENWLQQIAEARAKEDREMVEEYNEEEELLRTELDDAVCEHNRLTETLLQARVLVDEKKADLEWLVAEFRKRRKAIEDRRAADDFRVRAWITKGRRFMDARQRQTMGNVTAMHIDSQGSAMNWDRDNSLSLLTDSGSHPADQFTRASVPLHNSANGTTNGDLHGHSQTSPSPHGAAPPPTVPTDHHSAPEYLPNADGSVSVVNTSGDCVGKVIPIRPENHWVQALLERPVRRAVEIRLGRKFKQSHLDAIYEGHDQKRSKWLSFMIQATGEIQDRACQTCAKGQGLFSLCIIVGGTDFPRCGNCEWNKQGCHGASVRAANRVPLPTAAPKAASKQHQPPLSGSAGTPTKQPANDSFSQGSPMAMDNPDSRPSSSSKRGRTSLPHYQSPDASQHFESFMVRELSPPGNASDEITADMIALRDDGMIFLEPELMHGVPLRKISPDHAYWERGWKPFEGAIQSKLEEWTDKLAKLKALPDSSLTDKERTAVFQAGRQVNRGKATTRYLATCDFHPYQLVSKKWITPSLTHYDTLFRMVATLDELAKFRLDVTPLQWLRQRLYEIYLEKKGNFKLDRAIAKLYHDPKLAHLRSKNGFGNIGRPSAASKPRATDGGTKPGSADGSPDKKPTGEKRTEPPLGDTNNPTPSKRVHLDSEKRAGKDSTAQRTKKKQSARSLGMAKPGTATPTANPRVRKPPSSKTRDDKAPASTAGSVSTSTAPSRAASHATDAVPVSTEDEDLEYSGYTTTDSLTHDMVVKKDWRVYQVKTKDLATNPQTTQYWHWVDREQAYKSGPDGRRDFDPMFEHQVLKETEPTIGWGVFADPVDFHLRLRELTEVSFAPDSDIIVIGTREVKGIEGRGNVLAQFKRERTKRRFLAFLKKKGVPLRKTDRHEIETEWDGIQAEVMAGNESD